MVEDFGIYVRKDLDKINHTEVQDRKAKTIIKINRIEVFSAVDFLVDFKVDNENILKHKKVKILDIGTRNGAAIKRFNERGFSRTKGIDISMGAIKNAKKYNFNVKVQTIEDYNDDEKFDVVFCRHMLEHSYDIEKSIKKINKILVDNGIIFIIVPFCQSDNLIPSHNYNFHKENSLKLLIEELLNIEVFYYSIEDNLEKEIWLLSRKI